jgi:hypothetical protein
MKKTGSRNSRSCLLKSSVLPHQTHNGPQERAAEKRCRLSCAGSRVPCASPKPSACVWWPSSRMVSYALCGPRHSPTIGCFSLLEAHRYRSSQDLPADRFRLGSGWRWSCRYSQHGPDQPGRDARCWCSRSARPGPRRDHRLCRAWSQLPLWISRRWAPEPVPC